MKQPTTRLKFARIAPVLGICHVELDKLPKSNSTKSKRSPKRLLAEFVFFRFIRFKCQKVCLVIHFFTNQMNFFFLESNLKKVSR